MGYIGNTPSRIQAAFQGVESKSFDGDGSNQDFTLDRDVANTYDIEVVVNNVQQSPYDGSYSVSGTTLSFSEAPSTGSNNIYVTYRDTPQPSIVPQDGTVTTAKISDGAVTAAKLAAGAAVPDQTGHAGQFLTTDGTTADWATVDALPDQTGNSGYYLTTDGTTASWGTITIPDEVVKSATEPTSPAEGDLWYDTSADALHVYTGTDWEVISSSPRSYEVSFLAVGGGAGGGGDNFGGGVGGDRGQGGGGAGGYLTSFGSGNISGGNTAVLSDLSFTRGIVYTITVGGPGAGGPDNQSAPGGDGTPSKIEGSNITTVHASGGGGGGSWTIQQGQGGGSGGGSGDRNTSAGSGQNGQGHAGGLGAVVNNNQGGGGGGGGAGAPGAQANAFDPGGAGGAGLYSSITGTNTPRAGGGGGGRKAAGGVGGGGTGGDRGRTTNMNGSPYTGGGGGGAGGITSDGAVQGGNGGGGVVILRMPSSAYSGTYTGADVVVSVTGNDTVLEFRASGTYTG